MSVKDVSSRLGSPTMEQQSHSGCPICGRDPYEYEYCRHVAFVTGDIDVDNTPFCFVPYGVENIGGIGDAVESFFEIYIRVLWALQRVPAIELTLRALSESEESPLRELLKSSLAKRKSLRLVNPQPEADVPEPDDPETRELLKAIRAATQAHRSEDQVSREKLPYFRRHRAATKLIANYLHNTFIATPGVVGMSELPLPSGLDEGLPSSFYWAADAPVAVAHAVRRVRADARTLAKVLVHSTKSQLGN
jgi:hypothetical protein